MRRVDCSAGLRVAARNDAPQLCRMESSVTERKEFCRPQAALAQISNAA